MPFCKSWRPHLFFSCRDLPKVFEFCTACYSGDRLFLLISRFFFVRSKVSISKTWTGLCSYLVPSPRLLFYRPFWPNSSKKKYQECKDSYLSPDNLSHNPSTNDKPDLVLEMCCFSPLSYYAGRRKSASSTEILRIDVCIQMVVSLQRSFQWLSNYITHPAHLLHLEYDIMHAILIPVPVQTHIFPSTDTHTVVPPTILH